MARTIANVALFVLTVALLSMNWILRSDPSVRNIEFLPDMVESVPYDSFAANQNFKNESTLRMPVAGTIIRGYPPLHYAATEADAKRAGLELVSPAITRKEDLARGAAVYANFCETCHGPEGKGDGRSAQRGVPAPPSFLAPNALGLRDGQMFHILTYGQANMASYASQVDRDDRWRVIAYIRTLQEAAKPKGAGK